MKPQRHLAFAESVRLPFAEAQLILVDLGVAAAALGPTRRGVLDDMRH
jgi:hypothetical protein